MANSENPLQRTKFFLDLGLVLVHIKWTLAMSLELRVSGDRGY